MNLAHKENAIRQWIALPLGVFFLILIHAVTIGITDDEAYYWVLSRHLDWGYAYHPPMVAWWIAASRSFFEIFETPQNFYWVRIMATRFPVALSGGALFFLILFWLKQMGLTQKKLRWATLGLISFAGFFAGAWMMVPDVPLFLGLMLQWLATWNLCFSLGRLDEGQARVRGAGIWFGALFCGVLLSILSKYSGVLMAFSAIVSLFLWAPRLEKWRGIFAAVLGILVASFPILIWNSQHHWVSILYQLHDRHQGNILWKRFFGFWAAQIAIAGPALFVFGVFTFRRIFEPARLSRFVFVWALPPALVFGIQPLFGSFKPHWILVAWFPLALEMIVRWATAGVKDESRGIFRLWRIHLGFGLPLVVLFWLNCHFPIQGFLTRAALGRDPEPKWDVTNDLYGWRDLSDFVKEKMGQEGLDYPVVGSRYQTAAQAAFAWPDPERVTQIPRNEREWEEWPNLPVVDGPSAGWTPLISPVLYVACNRYTQEPQFPGAKCDLLGVLEKSRFSLLAKQIKVWKCRP